MGNDIMTDKDKPDLMNWTPKPEEVFYKYKDDGIVYGMYDKLGVTKDSPVNKFYIIRNHFKTRMADIVHHNNYFLSFYDTELESFMAIFSIKYIVDMNRHLGEKAFKDLILQRVVTPSFVSKCKMMSHDLCKININTDTDGRYRSTPKLTNAQAVQILALSFAYRIILPLCIHYTNTGEVFKTKSKKYYLQVFDKIFVPILYRFEENDIPVYTPLCRFTSYRVTKSYNTNRATHYQKKQIRGDSVELYNEELIHEVIIVKSLYKLDYRKSCVSFIDGVIQKFNINYGRENYRNKPYEIDSQDSSSDSDDYLSRAEILEMQAYKIDESNAMISDVNGIEVIEDIKKRFKQIPITDEEYKFYLESIKLNPITEFFMHTFYSKMFHDSFAIYNIGKETTVLLLIYLKKYLQLIGLPLLSQIVTAKIASRYKDSIIKNSAFIESTAKAPIHKNIIEKKFKYAKELDKKDDPVLRQLSTLINCSFEFIDMNEKINGFILSNVDKNEIRDEFYKFLSIV